MPSLDHIEHDPNFKVAVNYAPLENVKLEDIGWSVRVSWYNWEILLMHFIDTYPITIAQGNWHRNNNSHWHIWQGSIHLHSRSLAHAWTSRAQNRGCLAWTWDAYCEHFNWWSRLATCTWEPCCGFYYIQVSWWEPPICREAKSWRYGKNWLNKFSRVIWSC